MPFIHARLNNANIVINSDNILTVVEIDGKAKVHTVASTGHGIISYALDETYEAFLGKLSGAGLFRGV